ncbi:ankyrin repeat and SOCS box protein 8-like [Saccostrea cucullata]|uniref:ankyrin repeat and SOCS box protein 8-like n=1 Tax=Saccostrea cuccullata TaxID=36930 RepID=UPI002ED06491
MEYDDYEDFESCMTYDGPKPIVRRRVEWTPEALLRLLADAITYKSPIEDITLIIRCGADVNGRVKKGLRPLHYASFVNYIECVHVLLENGADVNLTDDIGYTPMHICARRGFHNILNVLIKHGAHLNFCKEKEIEKDNLNEKDESVAMSPLSMAIENNYIECTRILLENGASPTHKYFMGYEISIVPLDNLECMELLLSHGADPNVYNRCGVTPLMRACKEQKLSTVKLLLKYNADVNATCPARFEQRSPLQCAIQSGNTEITECLLKHGAFLNRPDTHKNSPLHEAIVRDNIAICELLLKYHANVEERTESGATPLMLACATVGLKKRRQIVELLLNNNANVNAFSENSSYRDPYLPPLIEYLKNNGCDIHFDVISLLIKFGAKVSFRGYLGVVRAKDHFGILHYMHNVFGKKEICHLLFVAACLYDNDSIKHVNTVNVEAKKCLMSYGCQPRELKHLCRLYIRDRICTGLPEKVKSLPLPSLLKSYLLFDL